MGKSDKVLWGGTYIFHVIKKINIYHNHLMHKMLVTHFKIKLVFTLFSPEEKQYHCITVLWFLYSTLVHCSVDPSST